MPMVCADGDLEAPREAAKLPVARFARLAGTKECTYRRLAKLRAGDEPATGPWQTAAVDAAETLAAKYAADWQPARPRRLCRWRFL